MLVAQLARIEQLTKAGFLGFLAQTRRPALELPPSHSCRDALARSQLAILLQLLIQKREALCQVRAANVRGVVADPGAELPGAFH